MRMPFRSHVLAVVLSAAACTLPVDDAVTEVDGQEEELLIAGGVGTCPGCSDIFLYGVENLHFTYDAEECAAHAGPDALGLTFLLCQQAILSGSAILVWDYPYGAVDAFRVAYSRRRWPEFEVERKPPNVTMYAVTSTPGACYVVNAVRGTELSDGQRACVPSTGAPAPQTITLPALDIVTRFDGDTSGPTFEGFDDEAKAMYETAPPAVSTGVTHVWNHPPWPLPDSWAWASARAAFRFELGAVQGKYIVRAELLMTESALLSPDVPSHRCHVMLQTANGSVHANPGLPDGADFSWLPDARAHVVDVTNPARGWAAQPETNFGFVLKTEGEGRKDSNDGCKSLFSSMQLKVTFLP